MLRSAAMVWCACIVAGSGTALAQSPSLVRHDFPSFAGARGIATADFDRNGWADVAHVNSGRHSVTVLLNQGRGTPAFVQAYDVPVGLGPFDLVAADFNRDGVPDLAVANADANSVSILTGRSSGAFTRADIAVARGPRGITAADMNKDGKPDLILTGWDSNTVQVLFGNGGGGFVGGPAVVGYAPHPQGVAAADFNKDGHLDLAVAYDSGGGLAVLAGNGGQSFALRGIPDQANLNVVATGDLNDDGWTDVAAASTSGNRVAVFFGGASGLAFDNSYPVGASPRGIVAADVNQDGRLDLATANRDSGTVSVLFGEPGARGSFTPAREFAAGAGSRALAAADFDRDGRLDIATANQNASSVTILWNETVLPRAAYSFERVSLGSPSNSFGSSNSAWPADFNEDGRPDVLTEPDWRLGPRRVQVLITGGSVVLLEFPHFVVSFAAGDYNSDGHADVLGWQGYDTVAISVFLGDGRGGFRLAPTTTSPLRFWDGGHNAGDLNRDGKADLVFTGYDPAARTSILQAMLGAGDGTFRPGARLTAMETVWVPRIVDVNRDGKPDIAGLHQGALAVWLGDGAGAFAAGPSAPWAHTTGSSLEFADINQDGFIDACSSYSDAIAVAMGTASGFGPSRLVVDNVGFANWRNIALADVSLDGTLDIVTDTGMLLRGRGDGTFEEPDLFDFSGSHVHVADFNRDGLPDLFVATADGAAEVIVNERNEVNHPPSVSAGADVTFEYAKQFSDDRPFILAAASDPDVHALAFQWRDEAGNLVNPWGGAYLEVFDKLPGTYKYTVTAFDGRGGSASDSVVVTIAPSREIVLWAANGYTAGNWSLVDDPTAAAGMRAYDANAGAPKVNAPLAAPANMLTLNFAADPTQTYKLWIRLKADGNHWSNDSVWVQFDGATDASGTPVYRIGTASGLAVNLEECSGCGESGWGWEDDGWGAVDRRGVTLRFPGGGTQRLVIQTREDGVSIDQVVLSADKYRTARPGSAKNDSTILTATYWPD